MEKVKRPRQSKKASSPDLFKKNSDTTQSDILSVIRKKLDLKEWTLKELNLKEQVFGMTTKEFVEKWRAGVIPEPEDSNLLADFQEWDGLAETFEEVEGELKRVEECLRANSGSHGSFVPA